MNERSQVIPIVHVRGNHYQCGFEVVGHDMKKIDYQQ